MRRMIAALFICLLAAGGCDAKKEQVLERLYGDVLDGESPANASVITDNFVLVSELNVVLPRPPGPEWRTEKTIERSSGGPIASVRFTRTDGPGSFAAFVSKGGDADDVRAQVEALGGMLMRTCGSRPTVAQSGGPDAVEVWLACPLVPRNEDGTMGTPRMMRAAVTIRQKIPGRTVATVGIWPPERDAMMYGAMRDVIMKVEPLLDANIGRP